MYTERQLFEWQKILEPSLYSNINIIAENIDDKDLFFDIGANVGSITEGLLKIKNNLNCVLVEPVSDFYEYCRNKFKENSNVEIYNCGISYKNAKCSMNIDQYNYGYTRTVLNENGESQLYSFEYFIKNIVKREPDFIKIDVEDHGIEVMLGLIPYLHTSKKCPKILIEKGWDQKYEKIITEYYEINFGYNIIEFEKDFLLKK